MTILKIIPAFLLAAILTVHSTSAQTSASPANNAEASGQRMLVDPSSTSVSLGKASLIVSPLSLKDGNYVGDYQLKVTPYFFKSQKGGLVLVPSGEVAAQLLQGKAMEFTGKATNSADGTVKNIKGKITPSTADKGAVTFSITTDNGEMVFKTTYHFAK